MKTEYVDIRSYKCAQCTARWLQYHVESYSPNIDSYFDAGCELNARQGAVAGEDNLAWLLSRHQQHILLYIRR